MRSADAGAAVRRRRAALGIGLALLAQAPWAVGDARIVVGSKNFTESYLLAEIAAQWLEADGHAVERRVGFGGTKVAFEALDAGEISIYPEYTGTISEVILRRSDIRGIAAINAELDARRLRLVGSPGFNNTYAIALPEATAERLGVTRISELSAHPALRMAFSHEFLAREDGWPGLRERYALPQSPSGIEHGLAYQALVEDKIDVTDAYSTDGDILRYDLRLLEDDLGYFPDYRAAWFVRTDMPGAAIARLDKLAGTIDDATMRRLNAEVVIDQRRFAAVAADFITTLETGAAPAELARRGGALMSNVVRHLQLTAVALLAAVSVGVALALAGWRFRSLARVLLYVAGLLQTIPSIALLALMLPLLGVGFLPAVVALFLYALLPILRSTLTALAAIDPVYRRVSAAMGMSAAEEFRHVLLPMALPHVLSGVRTASIISIGTATLAAFIGAGGLGQPIVTGLALNDTRLILEGAVPAALLAIATDVGFDLLERRLVPAHMRASRLPG